MGVFPTRLPRGLIRSPSMHGEATLADAVLENVAVRWLVRRTATRQASIFMLHRFNDPELGVVGYDSDHLRRALASLRRQRVDLISLRDLVRRVTSGERLQSPTAVFTVDDGYRDFERIGARAFAEFDCPVTVFVSTKVVSGHQWYWWDHVTYAFAKSPRRDLSFAVGADALTCVLEGPHQRAEAAEAVATRLKALTDRDRRGVLAELGRAAEVEFPIVPPPEYAPLSWPGIRRLESGLIEFGPHSRTHPILAAEDDARAQDEIAGSWSDIQRECRDPSPVFCYPNGTLDSFGARDARLVRDAGMTGAAAFYSGHVDDSARTAARLFNLPRRVLPRRPERTAAAVTGLLGVSVSESAVPPARSELQVSAEQRTPPSVERIPAVADAQRAMSSGAMWYTIAILMARSVSVLMLPVYTRYLTPSDYGVLQMLLMVSDIATILLTAGMTSGVQRFYFKATTDGERRSVISTAFFLEVGLALIGTLVMLASARAVAATILGDPDSLYLVRVTAVDFSLSMLSAVPLLYLQTVLRARAFVAMAMTKLLLQVSLNLLFVVGFELGAYGMLLSTLIANALLGVPLAIWLLRQTGARISRPALRDLRRFGVPNQFTFAGAFIITYGDRFFLQASFGLAVVGVYGLAYQFGFLLAQIAAVPFLQAWNPVRFLMATEPRASRDEAFSTAFFFFNFVLLGAAVMLGVFIQPALTILTTPAFRVAAYIVPIILAAYVVQSWMDVVKFGIDVVEKTQYHAYGTWISVLVTLAMYAALIPIWGAYGAAVATLIGFSVRFALSFYWSQRLWPVSYGWPRTFWMSLAGALLVVTYYVVAPVGLVRQVLLGAALSIAFVALVLGVFARHRERRAILHAIRSPRRALALLTNTSASTPK